MASLALSRLPQQLSHQCRPYPGPFHRWWRCHRPPRPPNLVFMHVSNYPIAQLSNRKSQMFLHTQFNLIPFLIRLSFLFSFFFLSNIPIWIDILVNLIEFNISSVRYFLSITAWHGAGQYFPSFSPHRFTNQQQQRQQISEKFSVHLPDFFSFLYIYIFFFFYLYQRLVTDFCNSNSVGDYSEIVDGQRSVFPIALHFLQEKPRRIGRH